MQALKKDTQSFWNSEPCGSRYSKNEIGTKEFFMDIQKHRFEIMDYFSDLIPFHQFRRKKVLVIGCGLGTDGVQFAKAGCDYTGIDFSSRSVNLAARKAALAGLAGKSNHIFADAERLPFKNEAFDIVYSHGVLHHTPDIKKAIDETFRVLRSGGQAIVMLYHRNSWNYWGNIMFLRRMGAILCFSDLGLKFVNRITGEDMHRLKEHQRLLHKIGLKYLTSDLWLSWNTDGACNPLSQVFSRIEILQLFQRFEKDE